MAVTGLSAANLPSRLVNSVHSLVALLRHMPETSRWIQRLHERAKDGCHEGRGHICRSGMEPKTYSAHLALLWLSEGCLEQTLR